MKWVALVLLVVPAVARAQPVETPPPPEPPPATEAAFEACKARRHAMSTEAMKIADKDQRARVLVQMPNCRRGDDGTPEVAEAVPPPPPEVLPPAPALFQLSVHGGYAATVVSGCSNDLDPDGFGPYLDVEAGYRWRPEWAVSLYTWTCTSFDSSHLSPLAAAVMLVDVDVDLDLDVVVDVDGDVDVDPAVDDASTPRFESEQASTVESTSTSPSRSTSRSTPTSTSTSAQSITEPHGTYVRKAPPTRTRGGAVAL